jgi:hypothetical protein
MAQQYDNTNTFTLFKNDKGDNPKRPDYTGTLNSEGVEFRLSGWIREGKNGKFISGSVQVKDGDVKPAAKDEDVPF